MVYWLTISSPNSAGKEMAICFICRELSACSGCRHGSSQDQPRCVPWRTLLRFKGAFPLKTARNHPLTSYSLGRRIYLGLVLLFLQWCLTKRWQPEQQAVGRKGKSVILSLQSTNIIQHHFTLTKGNRELCCYYRMLQDSKNIRFRDNVNEA